MNLLLPPFLLCIYWALYREEILAHQWQRTVTEKRWGVSRASRIPGVKAEVGKRAGIKNSTKLFRLGKMDTPSSGQCQDEEYSLSNK